MRKIKLFGISPFVLTILFFLQALLFANNAFAQNIIAKPNPATLVTDLAGVLTPEQKQALENKLVAIDDSSSNQIAVVIIPSLDGYPKEEYATKLFDSILNYNYLCLSNYKLFYTIISKFFKRGGEKLITMSK